MPTTPLAELAHAVRMSSIRLARRVRYHTESLPPHFFTVLSVLEGRESTTAAELAERERVSAPSMSRTVNELAERGYLHRQADPDDRRRQILSITPQGIAALAAGRRERDEWMIEKLQDRSPEDLDTLRRAAQILDEMLDVR